MKKWMLLLVLASILLTGGSWAGESRIVLREYLKQQWTNEMLTYPFAAEKGTCDARSVTLTGPQGPVPVQLSAIDYWPGTQWVKTAELSFVANLAPLGKDTYVVRYGNKPAAPPVTDLTVKAEKDQVEISTSRFGVRLVLGEVTYPEPVSVDVVPGPLKGMRLADGTWFGGSRLYGGTKIKSYAARLIATGPVLAEVHFLYTYADGSTVRLVAQVAAGDNAVYWDAEVTGDLPQDGWDLLLTPGLPPLVFPAPLKSYKNRIKDSEANRLANIGDLFEVRLDEQPAGLITNLSPWADWWDDFTNVTIPLRLTGRNSELAINSRDAGVWVMPRGGDKWKSIAEKRLPLLRGANGDIYFRINAVSGARRWSLGEYTDSIRSLRGAESRTNPVGPQPHAYHALQPSSWIGRRLGEVNTYVLDWPQDPQKRHPLLYLSRQQLEAIWKRPVDTALVERLVTNIAAYSGGNKVDRALGAYLLTGDAKIAEKTQLIELLRSQLGQMGHFDKMRSTLIVANIYDGLIDADLITPEERPVLRAQMAYLAYNLADPYTWSSERGYGSGNPNMHVAFVFQLGQLACLLPDHPMAKTWLAPALQMMESYLNSLGPEGEYMESVANYAHVTASAMLCFAIAAKNAGLHDYINDPRMKKMVLFLAKQYTPPDPRTGPARKPGFSRLPPVGRGPGGQRVGLPGMMARATADSDPAYSRIMQWVWLQTGGEPSVPDLRMSGFEYVYFDKNLPAANPGWGTEMYPKHGVIFRAGLGTPDAFCGNFQTYVWDGIPTANGSFAVLFAKGTLLSTVFDEGYIDREELLISKVMPARNRGATGEERNASFYHRETNTVTAYAPLSRQDYTALDTVIGPPVRMSFYHSGAVSVPKEWPPIPAAGKSPINWRRQVLFLKDETAAGVNYLLLRDTVKGNQPTMWQFWTLSEKIGMPDEVLDIEKFLADKPGEKAVEPRELRGDRFTAVGQFGVDLEYFIASPQATPRHTLRAGEKYGFYDWYASSDYQDLLHLQMPGDGTYFLALYPRRRGEPVPVFSTLGNGTIIKVEGVFGKDYGFLSAQEATASGEGVNFSGTAASVQDRTTGLVLSLGGKGEVRYKTMGLAAGFPAGLRVKEKTLTVELPAVELANKPFPGGTVTVIAPGNWALEKPAAGVKLTKSATDMLLEVPAGVRAVTLVAGAN